MQDKVKALFEANKERTLDQIGKALNLIQAVLEGTNNETPFRRASSLRLLLNNAQGCVKSMRQLGEPHEGSPMPTSILKVILTAKQAQDNEGYRKAYNTILSQTYVKLGALGFPISMEYPATKDGQTGNKLEYVRSISSRLSVCKLNMGMMEVGSTAKVTTQPHLPVTHSNKDLYMLVYDKAVRSGLLLQFMVLHIWVGSDDYGVTADFCGDY